jgi:acetyltransferase-like isoleucine patch superfamily enzyme
MGLAEIYKRVYRKVVENLSSDQKIRYWRKQGVKIGKNCHLETMCLSTEPYLIEIGDHVAIALGTCFATHDGGIWCFRDEAEDLDLFGKIRIGNNVFIGINCTILPNSVVGDNCIIGAGSVVRGRFPDNSVIFGNPATVVMKMSAQKFLYLHNPGLLHTKNLSASDKTRTIMDHYNLK